MIKAKNPKAHLIEIHHELRKDWNRLTISAKKDYESKAFHINQEQKALAMIKKIKSAFEANDTLDDEDDPPQPIKKKPKRKSSNVIKVNIPKPSPSAIHEVSHFC